MSALSGFLGGTIIGAGTAYTKLADEQRAFRIDQAKQDALYARSLNLKRAEKDMENSGVLDEAGMPMTNEQLDSYSGDRSALMGPIDQAAKLQKIREADQPSQFVNPQTRQILTKGELEEYRKVNGSYEGLSTVGMIQRQDTLENREYLEGRDAARFMQQERLQNQRFAESEKMAIRSEEDREERTRRANEEQWKRMEHKEFETSYRTLRQAIMKNASIVEKEAKEGAYPPITGDKTTDVRIYKDEVVIDTTAGWAEGLPEEYLIKANEHDPNFLNIIVMPEILRTGKVGRGPNAIPIAGKRDLQVKGEMLNLNIDEYTIDRFLDYAKAKGYMEFRRGSEQDDIPSTWYFKASAYEE